MLSLERTRQCLRDLARHDVSARTLAAHCGAKDWLTKDGVRPDPPWAVSHCLKHAGLSLAYVSATNTRTMLSLRLADAYRPHTLLFCRDDVNR